VIVWLPTASVVAIVNVPPVAVPVAPEIATPPSYNVTVLPASADPVTDTDVTFVVPSVVEVPVSVAVVNANPVGTDGADVSTVTVLVPALLAFPAASVATKLNTYTPLVSAAPLLPSGVHATELPVPVNAVSPVLRVKELPSFVADAATDAPLSAVTPSTGARLVTPSLLDVPLSDAVVCVTVGADGADVSNVKLTADDVVWLPVVSVAIART
jgi:hypothetical protein